MTLVADLKGSRLAGLIPENNLTVANRTALPVPG